MFKVLNIHGLVSQTQSAFMDAKKFQISVLYYSSRKLSGSFLNIYSVTKEPNLEEWTCRAESSDLLHEPVGFYSKADLYYP